MFALTILAMFAADPDFAAFQAGPAASPPAATHAPAYQWRYWGADPDRHYLYRGDVQVGAYCHRERKYRSFDRGAWGTPSDYVPHLPVPARGERVSPIVAGLGLPSTYCRA